MDVRNSSGALVRPTNNMSLDTATLQVFLDGATVKLAATSRQVASVVGELPLGGTAGCQPAASAYFVDAVLSPDPDWKVGAKIWEELKGLVRLIMSVRCTAFRPPCTFFHKMSCPGLSKAHYQLPCTLRDWRPV